MNRRALFLDRDGVINEDYGYVHTQEKFNFIEGIFELVLSANNLGYLVIIVTNQAGIGRGLYSEQQFLNLTNWMKGKFSERGAKIDAVYHCPYHEEHGIGIYRRASSWRKPAPGMLFAAATDHSIDLRKSVLVGDSETDIQAAQSAGISLIFHFQKHQMANKNETSVRRVSRLSSVIPHLTVG